MSSSLYVRVKKLVSRIKKRVRKPSKVNRQQGRSKPIWNAQATWLNYFLLKSQSFNSDYTFSHAEKTPHGKENSTVSYGQCTDPQVDMNDGDK